MIDAEAVLIDLYDTLAWSEWPELRDLICRRLGVSSEALLRAFDETRPERGQGSYDGLEADWSAVLRACAIEPDGALVDDLIDLERDFLLGGVHLHDDSLPVLRALRERAVKTAVVSNCSRSTRPVVDRLGLEDEVDAVILSFEVGAAKPNPAIYRAATDRLGVEPSARVIFVDDQERYCDGAAALGLRAVLIDRRGDPSPAEHPVIRSLFEVLDV